MKQHPLRSRAYRAYLLSLLAITLLACSPSRGHSGLPYTWRDVKRSKGMFDGQLPPDDEDREEQDVAEQLSLPRSLPRKKLDTVDDFLNDVLGP